MFNTLLALNILSFLLQVLSIKTCVLVLNSCPTGLQGTSCGAGHWCRRGSCEPQDRFLAAASSGPEDKQAVDQRGQPVHGAWSSWSR
jgi:hypothetical protein